MRLDDFPIGATVVLKTFWSTRAPPRDVVPQDDYWQLIGCRGVVVSTDARDKLDRHSRGPRVLVKFEVDVRGLGLACHNPEPNALYLFADDLERIA